MTIRPDFVKLGKIRRNKWGKMEAVAPNYQALADSVAAEMDRQQLQPKDIKQRGGPTYPTVKSILDAEPVPDRWPSVLRKLSESLGKRPDWAARILAGNGEPAQSPLPEAAIRSVIGRLTEVLEDLALLVEEQAEGVAPSEVPPRRRRPAG